MGSVSREMRIKKNQKKMMEINNIIIERKIEIKNTLIKMKNAFDGLISTGYG